MPQKKVEVMQEQQQQEEEGEDEDEDMLIDLDQLDEHNRKILLEYLH